MALRMLLVALAATAMATAAPTLSILPAAPAPAPIVAYPIPPPIPAAVPTAAAAAGSTGFISQLINNPIQLLQSHLPVVAPIAPLVPVPAVPAASSVFNLDAHLQQKLNLILGQPALRPFADDDTAAAATPVQTLAEHVTESSRSASHSLILSGSNPSEIASASARFTSYGVPVAQTGAVQAPAPVALVLGGPRANEKEVATFAQDAKVEEAQQPTSEQVFASDDKQQYVSSYRLEDGTQVSEQGRFVEGANGEGMVFVKHGRFEYVSPEGTPVKVNWVADQNGYRVVEN